MNLGTRDGSGQETGFKMTITKPFIPKNGNPYYNPETYTNSQLNMGNKRTPIKPDNFVGFNMLRQPNMQPNRQHQSGALNPPVAVPILHTQPIQKVFH